MKITDIFAGKDEIRIIFDEKDKKAVRISAYVPLINAYPCGEKYPGRRVFCTDTEADGGQAVFCRYSGYDLSVCRFEVSCGKETASGVCYVTGFDEGYSMCDEPYPEIKRPLGTWCYAPDEDVEYMRMGMMMDELDEAWLIGAPPREDDIIHIWNGKEYRFDRKHTELHDLYLSKLAKKGIPTLLRFICRRKYQGRQSDGALFDIIRHPDYEEDFGGVEMSAFNLRTEEGFEYYCACLDFMFSRYAAPGSPYGYSTAADIGNEINSARIWYNCGKAECAEMIEEYSVALRLAWLISQKYHVGYRVGVSLEMNFGKAFANDPLHYYPAKRCLTLLSEYCRRDGDFYWGVSAHPYPERLEFPDFYNDRQPTFSLDTPVITMKNPEVWDAFLSLPEMLYKGRARRVIFDEQGFNTREGEPYTEEQGACAFILAYLKIRKCKTVDAFLIHRHIDLGDGDEYGLRLGLRYFGGYEDEDRIFPIPGRRKLICDAIAATGTEREAEWVKRARDFIGHGLFDSLVSPPEITLATAAEKTKKAPLIRRAELDCETVRRLIELSGLWADEGCSYGLVKNDRDDIKEPVYAAYDGDDIVGYAFGHFYTVERKTSYIEPGERCFELDELYVLPKYRSRGVGRKLFDAISHYASEGAALLTLSTSTKDYKKILNFYVDSLGCDFHDAFLIKRL